MNSWKFRFSYFKESYLELFLFTSFPIEKKYWALSHTELMHQLSSGRLLTLRLLPISATSTTVECNIYGGTLRHTTATRLEYDFLKKKVQLEIQRIELRQRELLDQNNQFHDSEDFEPHIQADSLHD